MMQARYKYGSITMPHDTNTNTITKPAQYQHDASTCFYLYRHDAHIMPIRYQHDSSKSYPRHQLLKRYQYDSIRSQHNARLMLVRYQHDASTILLQCRLATRKLTTLFSPTQKSMVT